jgi:uncharacterized protein (TIGR03067 family)
MRWFLAGIVCFGIAIHVLDARGGDKTAPKIEGTWQLTNVTFPDGKKAAGDELAKIKSTFIFKDGKFQATHEDKVIASGSFKIDTTQKPMAIDLTYDADKTSLGILKIDGDTLTLAERIAGKQRPQSFEGGTGLTLYVMKRAK